MAAKRLLYGRSIGIPALSTIALSPEKDLEATWDVENSKGIIIHKAGVPKDTDDISKSAVAKGFSFLLLRFKINTPLGMLRPDRLPAEESLAISRNRRSVIFKANICPLLIKDQDLAKVDVLLR